MPALRRACSYAFSEGVPRRSFLVAIVVGTILNLINQGDAVLGAASINWIKGVRNTLRTEAQTVMATAAITLLRYQEGESCSAIKNAASSGKRCRHTAHAASAGTKQRISILPRRLTYQTTASPTGFPPFRMIAFSGTRHHKPLIGTQKAPARTSYSVRCPSEMSQQGTPSGLRTPLNHLRTSSGTFSNCPRSTA